MTQLMNEGSLGPIQVVCFRVCILNHRAVEDSREEKKKQIVAYYVFIEYISHLHFKKLLTMLWKDICET